MTSGPEHSTMINRRSILHRFKLSQNTPLSDMFIFNFLSSSNFQNIVSNCVRMFIYKRPRFSAVPTSESIAIKCNSSNFKISVSNSIRIYRLASFISICSEQFQLFFLTPPPPKPRGARRTPNPRPFSYF